MIFHWIMTFLSVTMAFGGILDARQHLQHGFELETFFTSTHALLFGGWILGGVAMAIYIQMQRRKGKSMEEWLPKGYAASLLGFLVFTIGGGIDLFWHEISGFEANVESAISPGHVSLLIGAGLIYSAVIFHSLHLQKENPEKFSSSLNLLNLPAILGITALLTVIWWPAWFLDPILVDFPSGGVIAKQIQAYAIFEYGSEVSVAAGVAGVIVMTLLTMPFLLLPLHRWRMPVGFMTLTIAGATSLRAIVGESYVYLPAAIGAAILGDLIWAWMRKGGEERLSSPTGYRLIAFFVPIVHYSLYFAIIKWSIGSLIWSVYLWSGATFIAGIFSLLMSYIFIEPKNDGIDSLLYRLNILEN